MIWLIAMGLARGFPLRLPAVFAISVAASLGQDIDTAILSRGGLKQSTILDQIADPGERARFSELYKLSDARKRLDLASVFLREYPRSWMLAQVYEIAAKASIELEDFSRALEFGAKSLRLFPENPFLLVPLANVQVKQSLFAAAERSARDALWCLERFDRPASVSETSWPALKRSLTASSYFVLGRSAATQAFGLKDSGRAKLLLNADAALREAIALNRDDPEISFLLGMVNWGLGKSDAAAPYFAETYRRPGPLQSLARARLLSVYQSSVSSKAMPFEEYAASLKMPTSAAAAAPRTQAALPAYAGSESCRECHATQHASWRRTGMGRMFRAYAPENVMADFSRPNLVADPKGVPSARTVLDHGRHFMEIRTAGGQWNRYPIDYIIGSKWQQAYATKLPGGLIQVFPAQYSKIEKRFINYWEVIDVPGSERADISKFDSIVAAGNYQLNCALCHTSQLRLPGGWSRPPAAEFQEGGVNCEMCHGPSGAHVSGMKTSAAYAKTPSQPPVDFKRIGAGEYVSICAQCHLQSAVREPEADGAMNYSRLGPRFYRSYLSRPYVDFARKAFYKDGRFQKTTFVIESFVRSACFRKGQAQCGSCHNPHPADPATNPAALKFPHDPDRMCVQCHAETKFSRREHTGHSLESEASRCVSCHMPKIMSSLMFAARSHQIDDIPSLEMTERFGQIDSPNACLICHRDRDLGWLRKGLKR